MLTSLSLISIAIIDRHQLYPLTSSPSFFTTRELFTNLITHKTHLVQLLFHTILIEQNLPPSFNLITITLPYNLILSHKTYLGNKNITNATTLKTHSHPYLLTHSPTHLNNNNPPIPPSPTKKREKKETKKV